MDEITLRLPAETTALLSSEADERGVSLDEHLRDIIDAYRADDETPPGRTVEYVHTVGQTGTAREETTGHTEEIASFRYGSRSVLSE
jgi:hypothetical protein